ELVAGGNDQGDHLNQLSDPRNIFLDKNESLYISDHNNHRVMKYKKGAKEGEVVAGGNGEGNSLNQLSYPGDMIVDHLGQIYVADCDNHRIMRWCEGDKEGEIVVGGNDQGNQSNQLNNPTGLSFDNEENLYVVDHGNHRIQKFENYSESNLYEDLGKPTLHMSDYDMSTQCRQKPSLSKEQNQLTTNSSIDEANNSTEVEPISAEEESYYEECKQYHRITGMPLVSVSSGVLNNTTELKSALLKFVIDEDYNGFNVEEFLKKICSILNINRNDIAIAKIQEGCVVLELDLLKKIDNKSVNIKLQALYHSLTDKLREEMGRLKVFFMYMGDLISFTTMQNFRNEIKLHPQWNRAYGMDHTYWTGTLDDGRDRGPYPYYCPVGWKRYALYVTDNYDDRFKGWSICYHGTKFSYGLSILLSGLKPAEVKAHGAGIYASPSIIYSSHPRYSEIKEIKPSEQTNFFPDGKYVQFMLQCRVHPTNIITIGSETLEVENTTIDSNVDNKIIEWLIDTKGKSIVDFNDTDAAIVCTGIMIRVTDKHPGLLPESQWWYASRLCNKTNCCALGIDLTTLTNQKANGNQCNIIFS
ncbi:unnamed protein product, partial [Adineta steineri]